MFRKIAILLLALNFLSCNILQGEDKSMEDQIAAINKKCPQMLDSETRIDKVELKVPNTIVYRYTLVNLLAENVDTLKFYKMLWPGLLSYIKVSDEMKNLRNSGSSVEYCYSDKKNKEVYRFKIGPKDYNQSK